MGISQTALVVAGPFGATLSAEDVARAIARGLQERGLARPDLCPIEAEQSFPARDVSQTPSEAPSGRARRPHGRATAPDVATLLASLDFDTRMRGARAVVLAEAHLRESTLRGSVAFEIATRARQGGVPAYAVTCENALTPFDARILDLQMILEASSPSALAAAGRKLAQVL